MSEGGGPSWVNSPVGSISTDGSLPLDTFRAGLMPSTEGMGPGCVKTRLYEIHRELFSRFLTSWRMRSALAASAAAKSRRKFYLAKQARSFRTAWANSGHSDATSEWFDRCARHGRPRCYCFAPLTLPVARQFDFPLPLRFDSGSPGSSAFAAGQVKRQLTPEGA